MNLNRGISTSIAILIIVVIAALAGGVFYWQSNQLKKPNDFKFRDQEKSEKSSTTSRDYFLSPVNEVATTGKVQLIPVYSSRCYGTELRRDDYCSSEILFLSKHSRTPEGQKVRKVIFNYPSSHSFGGASMILKDMNTDFSLSHIGLKINNPDLIKDISIELALDYRLGGEREVIGSNLFEKLIPKAHACGPSSWTKKIKETSLNYVKTSNEISWYELEEPIKLYDLPAWETEYWATPEEDTLRITPTLEMLKDGGLNAQIYYTPNDKEGRLEISVVKGLVKDKKGKHYEFPALNYSDRNPRWVEMYPSEKRPDWYKAQLGKEERGFIDIVHNSEKQRLELRFKNEGRDDITINEGSLWHIQAQSTEQEIESIELKNLEGEIIKSFSMEEMKEKLIGKRIETGEEYRLNFKSTEDLPENSLYYFVINTDPEKEKWSEEKIKENEKKVIQWNFSYDYYSSFFGTKSKLFPCLVYKGKDFVKLNMLDYYTGEFGWEEVDFDSFDFSVEIELSYADTENLDLDYNVFKESKITDMEKIASKSRDPVWSVIVPQSKIEDYIGTTDKLIKKEVDYLGDALEIYEREDVISYIRYSRKKRSGWVTDEPCNIAIIYEIPKKWQDNEKLFQYVSWVVRVNPVVERCD